MGVVIYGWLTWPRPEKKLILSPQKHHLPAEQLLSSGRSHKSTQSVLGSRLALSYASIVQATTATSYHEVTSAGSCLAQRTLFGFGPA